MKKRRKYGLLQKIKQIERNYQMSHDVLHIKMNLNLNFGV